MSAIKFRNPETGQSEPDDDESREDDAGEFSPEPAGRPGETQSAAGKNPRKGPAGMDRDETIFVGALVLLVIIVVIGCALYWSRCAPVPLEVEPPKTVLPSFEKLKSHKPPTPAVSTEPGGAAATLEMPEPVAAAAVKSAVDIEAKDPLGNTALHVAAAEGDIAAIERLLAEGADLEARNAAGETPLLKAIVNMREESLVCLLDQGAEVNMEMPARVTPLHAACSAGFADGVRALVQVGADVGATDGSGNTPLHLAIARGRFDIADLLMLSNVEARNSAGETPLFLAVRGGNQGCVQNLMAKGASVNVTNNALWTPLHVAVKKKNDEMAKWLIRWGAHVNARAKSKVTPLHLAALGNCPELVEWLAKTNALINAVDANHYTPIDYAVVSHSKKIVSLLMARQGRSSIRAAILCPSCQGSKICPLCNGYKQIKCKVCLGTGRGAQGAQSAACRRCNGSGQTPGIGNSTLRCPACGGKGAIEETSFSICSQCSGKGVVVCPDCNGEGRCNKCNSAGYQGSVEVETEKAAKSILPEFFDE
ncbi:MAG: ankyrin repeat domain-containing protein [Lentisphaerae bacterium]|nr:ankyrin repeat domain-containing protein [Lentisphaerota bacterium]